MVFMSSGDMRDRGLDEFDPADIVSFSKDGTRRAVYGTAPSATESRAAARRDTWPS